MPLRRKSRAAARHKAAFKQAASDLMEELPEELQGKLHVVGPDQIDKLPELAEEDNPTGYNWSVGFNPVGDNWAVVVHGHKIKGGGIPVVAFTPTQDMGEYIATIHNHTLKAINANKAAAAEAANPTVEPVAMAHGEVSMQSPWPRRLGND